MIISVLVIAVLIGRAAYLQIYQGEYYAGLADGNRIRIVPSMAPRGTFYDRNGELLVTNRPGFSVSLLPLTAPISDDVIDRLSDLLKVPTDEIKTKIAGHSGFNPIRIKTDVTPDIVSIIEEQKSQYPGVVIEVTPIRDYILKQEGAHTFGYVSEINDTELEKMKDEGYKSGDIIGKFGLEKVYDKELRGENGGQQVEVDVSGKPVQILGRKEPVPGDDLELTIDINLQQAAEKAVDEQLTQIGAHAAAAVVMNPQTGEILAMVSRPAFDPNLFAHGISSKDWNQLNNNPYHPMDNKTITGEYPPGSTFKTAQALTFLQEEIIHEDYPTFPCAHGFNHKGLHVGCHGHGSPLSLIPAIATSCNSYFCWGLYRMFGDKKYGSPQNAITVWKDHMVSQGFGYRLGTDLPGEQRGLIPNAKFYDKPYRGSWNGLTVISISIGQGEILATPLQIANLGATIANRGHFITPHIVKEIEDNELDSIYRNPRYPTIDREYYEMVVKGMRAAVDGSTGSATCRMAGAILPGVEVCGKTGTAQNRGKDHSVFMGFAPMDNPKIAIAVYVENGGFGATYGVPIGAMMMDQYLHGKLSPENEIRAEEFSNRVILYGDEER